jgi:Ca-activated chloride channel family protein
VLSELEIGSVGLGGTSIGDAIHKGLECFQDEFPNHKAIILITDGEDHAEFVKDAIEKARQRNVLIFPVGLGDSGEGRRIPIEDENGNLKYLEYNGQQVWTKMNPELLMLAAVETGGTYVGAGTKSINLVDIYNDNISTKVEEKVLEGAKEERFKDRFQWFLGIGLFLLLIEPLFTTRKRLTDER